MNERQKEVLHASLTDEQAVLDALQRNYTAALADVKRSIKVLQANPLTQSKAYQLEYQQALERQIMGALDVLQSKNFTTIAEYLQAAYQTAYVGGIYDLHGQGVPVMLPINEQAVLRSVQKTGDDYKLSRKLGGNTDLLKKQVQDEITRGLAGGFSYAKIARTISDYGEADYKRSARIARTEGHRVQNEARMDCMKGAKAKGADVVKQWDSTLDGRTRESHAQVDGEIREMDDPFSNGLMFPGDPDGEAAEVVNCRCAMLVRARWALDADELKTLQDRAAFFGLDKTQNFDDFRSNYLKAVANSGTVSSTAASTAAASSISTCQTFDELARYMDQTYGIPIDGTVRLLDYSAVHEGITGIERVMLEFPKAQSTLQGIGTSNSGVMCATFQGKINFNPFYYVDGNPSVRRSMVQGGTTGFHPKNTGVVETGSHEMGHILERALIEMRHPGTDVMAQISRAQAWNKSEEAKAVVSAACKAAKKTPEGRRADGKAKHNASLKSEVSGYATKNDSECLAECVADYVANGDHASILSREVWKILKGLLT